MIKKIKTSDKVIILAGKHKGQSGIVKSINNEKNRVIIEGLNLQACFSVQKKQNGKMKEMSIHFSNVSHVDPDTNKATRTKIVVENGVKSIVSKKSNKIIRTIIDMTKENLKKLGRYEKV